MMPKRSGTSADSKPLKGSRLTPASNTALSPSAASTSAPCLLLSKAIAKIVHDHVVNGCSTWSAALKVTFSSLDPTRAWAPGTRSRNDTKKSHGLDNVCAENCAGIDRLAWQGVDH